MRSASRCSAGTRNGMPALAILRLARSRRCDAVDSGDQERLADRPGAQPAGHPQGERDPAVQRQRRVAAGEQQPQPVVVDRLALLGPFGSPVAARSSRPPPPAWPVRWSGAAARPAPGAGPRWSTKPPGCPARPSTGHRASARSTASCTLSSARSQSPVTRIRVAVIDAPLVGRGVREQPPDVDRFRLTPRTARTGAAPAVRPGPSGAGRRSRWPRRGRRTPGRRSRRSSPWTR